MIDRSPRETIPGPPNRDQDPRSQVPLDAKRSFPITKAREDAFIKAVEDGGSDYAAARIAHTGKNPGVDGGVSTWKNYARRRPEFAVRWHQAKEHYLGRLETEMSKRVLESKGRAIYQNGVLVGFDGQRSDLLLLRSLAAADPQKWSEKKQVEMTSRSMSVGLRVEIDAAAIMLLPPEDRPTFAKLLSKIRDAQKEIHERSDRSDSAGTSAS